MHLKQVETGGDREVAPNEHYRVVLTSTARQKFNSI